MAVNSRARDLLVPLVAAAAAGAADDRRRRRHRAAARRGRPRLRPLRHLAGGPRPLRSGLRAWSATRSSTSSWRTERAARTRTHVRQRPRDPSRSPPSWRSPRRSALVFFYAPLDADQGFIQKIFYLHVPLAIVRAGRLRRRRRLRDRATCARGDRSWDVRSYVAIHMSLIFGVGVADHRLDLGQGVVGPLVGLGRADAGQLPDRLPALRDLLPAALRDRGPRAPGALRLGLRDHRRRLRAAQLPRRAAGAERSSTRACFATANGGLPGSMMLTFLVCLAAMALLWVTPGQVRADREERRGQVKRLRRALDAPAPAGALADRAGA